jgi:hypothetical protein
MHPPSLFGPGEGAPDRTNPQIDRIKNDPRSLARVVNVDVLKVVFGAQSRTTGDLSKHFRRPAGGMTYGPEVGPK